MKSSQPSNGLFARAGARVITLAAVATVFTVAADGPKPEQNSNPGIRPAHSAPYGRSYNEWAAAWWQWALSFPADANPVLDPTGELCSLGDQGNVWFLAGTFGGEANRVCTIPAGRGLLLPVVNIVWIHTPDDGPIPPECVAADYECLREILRSLFEGVEATLEIDGRAVHDLEQYRKESVVFEVVLPPDNVFGVEAGGYGPCVDDGMYVMLAPLSRGLHTIHVQATIPAFAAVVDVSYVLTVE